MARYGFECIPCLTARVTTSKRRQHCYRVIYNPGEILAPARRRQKCSWTHSVKLLPPVAYHVPAGRYHLPGARGHNTSETIYGFSPSSPEKDHPHKQINNHLFPLCIKFQLQLSRCSCKRVQEQPAASREAYADSWDHAGDMRPSTD